MDFTSLLMKIKVFWYTCLLWEINYRRFGGACCLHLCRLCSLRLLLQCSIMKDWRYLRKH